MNDHHVPLSDELSALALQYIGDELTEDARAAFESRLLGDQAAREAVAGAVEMSLAARQVFAEDAALVSLRDEARRPVGSKAWWNVVLGGCALAAMVLVTQSLQLVKQRPVSDPSELATAWSEARDEWPTTALKEEQQPEFDLPISIDELALPTWMIAAVEDGGMTEMSETTTGDNIPE